MTKVRVSYDPRSITAFCHNVLSDAECDELLSKLNSYELKPGHVYSPEKKSAVMKDVRVVNIAALKRKKVKCDIVLNVLDRMEACVKHVNKKHFHFKISHDKRFDNTNGRGFQYLKYSDPGDFFEFHQDWGHWNQFAHRRLTALLQLSPPDEYEGCNLEVSHMFTSTVPRVRGGMIVFPSFWYHRVTPLISGERHCIVAWFTGKQPML